VGNRVSRKRLHAGGDFRNQNSRSAWEAHLPVSTTTKRPKHPEHCTNKSRKRVPFETFPRTERSNLSATTNKSLGTLQGLCPLSPTAKDVGPGLNQMKPLRQGTSIKKIEISRPRLPAENIQSPPRGPVGARKIDDKIGGHAPKINTSQKPINSDLDGDAKGDPRFST